MKRAIIIGAGRIGRGFIAELMARNDFEIIFFEYSPSVVDDLNRIGSYTVHVLGNEVKNTFIDNIKAFETNDYQSFSNYWDNNTMIFTAVGGKNLPAVGKLISEAYNFKDNLEFKSNVITCENWIDPAVDLKNSILKYIDVNKEKSFIENIGIAESVVMCTGTGAPDNYVLSNPLDTWVQDFWYLPIDGEAIKGETPEIKYVKFVENFGNLLKQKIYTNNTSVATVAYLGYLLGLKQVAESANHPRIQPILDGVYEEINEILIKSLNIDPEGQYEFSKAAKQKYTDERIVDIVVRIARDPLRKLGPMDRFIGPINLAISVGVNPKNIALGAAAALLFDYSQDESAQEMQNLIQKHGVGYILETVSKLDANGKTYQLILESLNILKEEGWLKL